MVTAMLSRGVLLSLALAVPAWADGGEEPARHRAPSRPPLEKPRSVAGRAGADRAPRVVGPYHLLLDTIAEHTAAEAVSGKPGVFSAQLFDTRDGSVSELEVPLAALLEQHPEVMAERWKPGAQPPFWWAVLRFEPAEGRAALLFSGAEGLNVAWWSLASGRFERPVSVEAPRAEGELREYGLTPEGVLDLVLWRYLDPTGKKPGAVVTLRRFDFATRRSTRFEHVMEHPTLHYRSPAPFFDPTHGWAALAVQVDDGVRAEYPVRFVELATGEFFDVPALPHVYTVAFDVQAHAAWLASASTGVIQRIDLATRKVHVEKRGFGRVHSLTLSPDRKRLLVLPSTSSFYSVDASTLAVHTSTRWADWLGAPIVFPWARRVATLGGWVVVTDVSGKTGDSARWTAVLRWSR